MSDQVITTAQFSWYADYFAYAAVAGLRTADPLVDASLPVVRVNPSTWEVFEDAVLARENLLNNLRSSYESVYSEGVALQPMRQAFVDLADHIYEWTGLSVDDYLTANGIKVFPAYASIMNALGMPISSSNIKEA
jgi:hypothetical protein